jgi:hypothetical protein
MEDFWQTISGAPWWVYLLFIILLSVGLKAMHERTVRIPRVVIFPLIFLAWSLYGLYAHVMLGLNNLIAWWVIFLVIGAILGFKEVHSWRFGIDRRKGLVTIPGNYSTLILVVLIFVLKFIWNYIYTALMVVPDWILIVDTITSAVITGVFVGRGVFICKKYQKG